MAQTLFFDMDGVLCDFEAQCHQMFRGMRREETAAMYQKRITPACFWKEVQDTKGEFWSTMPPTAPNLRQIIKEYQEDYNVVILTSPHRKDPYCIKGKKEWVERYLGKHTQIQFVDRKETFAKFDSHILIDDDPDVINQWGDNGGTGILFTGWKYLEL